VNKTNQVKPLCPYCGAQGKLVEKHVVFRGKSGWMCSNYPDCDSYVGVHPMSSRPLGSMANEGLRQERVRAHKCVDHYWRGRGATLKRSFVYGVIENVLGRPFHVGMAREDQISQFFEAWPVIDQQLRTEHTANVDAAISCDQQTLRRAMSQTLSFIHPTARLEYAHGH
jgi:hypothetical protein